MNDKRIIRVGLGATAVCLFLLVLLLPLLAGRGTVQARNAGEGDEVVYLPLVMRLLSPMTTATPTVTNTPPSTSTPSATYTVTPTFTPTATGSPTPTYTPTPTTTASFTITRVSVASDGTEGNDSSSFSSISADGRYVAFHALANNLVNGDTNNWYDIFVHDQQTGQTSRVSVASDGTEGNGQSQFPSISANGRYIAFDSGATNLGVGDTNSVRDVFVHDRQTGQTSRISVSSDGTQGNGISFSPSISADGRFVAFWSNASNLVIGDTNNVSDVFIHDRLTGQTSRASIASDGTQGNGGSGAIAPGISSDGRYISFLSLASNLVSDDTNNELDIFVHDRQTGETSRVSVASDGTEGNGAAQFHSISGDGRYVVFDSVADNLVSNDLNGILEDVFVHDTQTGQTSLVSIASDGTQGDSRSAYPSISPDGRYVVFHSGATNLVDDDTNNADDIFVHDRQFAQTYRISVSWEGMEGNGFSKFPSISANGRYIAFESDANNLVSGDTNGVSDVFVYDRGE